VELFYFIAGRKTSIAGRNILRQKQFSQLSAYLLQPVTKSIAARNGSLSLFPEAILITAPRIAARKKGSANSLLVIFRCFLFLGENVFKDEILRF
jgi:hypothetical protein